MGRDVCQFPSSGLDAGMHVGYERHVYPADMAQQFYWVNKREKAGRLSPVLSLLYALENLALRGRVKTFVSSASKMRKQNGNLLVAEELIFVKIEKKSSRMRGFQPIINVH